MIRKVKRYLDLDDSDNYDDDIISDFIEATIEEANIIANRSLTLKQDKQTLSSSNYFYLKNTPILSVESVKIKGKEITNYTFDDECLYFDTKGQEVMMTVEYTGGMKTLPLDIQNVIIKSVVRQYRDYKDETYNLTALKEGTVSMNYIEKSIFLDTEIETIEKYRYINI